MPCFYSLERVFNVTYFLIFHLANGRFSFDPTAKLGLDVASCIITRYVVLFVTSELYRNKRVGSGRNPPLN